MEQKRIFFRTRGGPTQGWGNVFRLVSFASWCRERGHEDLTFFAEGPPDVMEYIASQGFALVPLPEDIGLDEEHRIFSNQAPADLIFVEMLDISPDRQLLLTRHSERLVVFDDLCDHVYYADLVVSGQELPSHANAAISDPTTEFLVGYEYYLSRPEFASYAGREREHSDTARSVLVTLGGGRYDIGYEKAALAIASMDRPLEASFILGYGDHVSLEARIRKILPDAVVLGAVGDLERWLWASDLAIVSAGYTKLEAAITQTPCVVMSVQWHQIPLAAAFSARTGAEDVGYMSYAEPRRIAEALERLGSREAREASAECARDVLDGRGFERVYNAAFGDAA